MAPIALPALSAADFEAISACPLAPPQDPPTAADAAAAAQCAVRARKAYVDLKIPFDTLDTIMEYESRVVAETHPKNVAPAWFHLALDDALDIFREQGNETLDESWSSLRAPGAKAYNTRLGDGIPPRLNFVAVPFTDGLDPLHATHSKIKTPIRTLDDIQNLSGPEAAAYYKGYYGNNVPVPRAIRARKEAIRKAIGCTARLA